MSQNSKPYVGGGGMFIWDVSCVIVPNSIFIFSYCGKRLSSEYGDPKFFGIILGTWSFTMKTSKLIGILDPFFANNRKYWLELTDSSVFMIIIFCGS